MVALPIIFLIILFEQKPLL